jgi:hypothetical protein
LDEPKEAVELSDMSDISGGAEIFERGNERSDCLGLGREAEALVDGPWPPMILGGFPAAGLLILLLLLLLFPLLDFGSINSILECILQCYYWYSNNSQNKN